MRNFYGHDVNLIKNLSVTGRRNKRCMERKEAISNENRSIMENIFMARLEAIGLDASNKIARKKRLNSLMKSAISNMIQKANKDEQKSLGVVAEANHKE